MVTRIVKTPQGKKPLHPPHSADDSLLLIARQVGAAASEVALNAARMVQENMSKTAAGVIGVNGGERMSKVDRAWWRMDSPTNLMMIVGFWILKPRVDYETACQREQVQDNLRHAPAAALGLRFVDAIEQKSGNRPADQPVDVCLLYTSPSPRD